MIKKIKNNTNENITLRGQTIFPGEYYQISHSEEFLWMSDPLIITNIMEGEVIINDGTNDITNTINAIEYLTSILPTNIITSQTDTYLMQTDSITTQVTSGESANLDFKIENFPGEYYIAKFVKGGTIFVKNGEYGDYINVDIIDKDNVLGYGANLIIKKYCYKMFIKPEIINTLQCPFAPGRIPVGLYVRTTYHSVGSNNVDVYLTLMIFANDNMWMEQEESSSSSS